MRSIKAVNLSINCRIALALPKSPSRAKEVIGRYTAAFAVNFTDWLGRANLFTRHEHARFALQANLRCEVADDHVGMLLRFAKSCNSIPEREHYAVVQPSVEKIRQLFTKEYSAGLAGVVVVAALEEQAVLFIPHLAILARECGCTDYEYTNVHGASDTEHALNLAAAVQAEKEYYGDGAEKIGLEARERVFELLEKIFVL